MVRLANQLSPRWEDNVPLTGRPLAVALALLRKWIAADARPVLVVLDHADLLDEPERVAGALAQLRGDPQVRATFVILARSDRPEIAGQLDTRRFRLDRLAANHVVDILASRADSAFQEGAVSRETLAHLAAAAGHDLRVGIGALRHMANRADQEARKLLEPAWVDEAVDAVRIEALRDAWLTLPIQHHAVLQTILEATESGTKPISSGDIQRAHREKLRGSEGPGGRMISNVIRAMHNSGLIQAPINNRGRGGRTRNVTVHHAALLQAWINEASQR
jgi:Cdc6-like AAA superfamily ATPase